MKFLGRTQEKKKLLKIVNENTFNTTLIYGRRVGKSELVKNVLKGSKILSIYYECKKVSEKSNIKGICNTLSETLNLPILGFNTSKDTLDYIFSLDKKIILVLDEYSYFKDTIKGMDSILQSLIDKYKDVSKLSLIILGSYVDTMQSLLMTSNPLYGRIDYIINLLPMDYYESSLFYPNYSYVDKVKIYSVFGGIPYYNKLVDDEISVKDNIINLIASNDARLENKVAYYLNQEISKIVNANEVLWH